VSTEAPGPLPEPPADLDDRPLPLLVVAHPIWFRGHKRSRDPMYFNKTAGRFAPVDQQSFGTLYLGEDEYAAFIEAFSQGFGSTPLGLFISESLLRQSCLCAIRTARPMRLVDISSGAALKRLSAQADNRINDGPHRISQRWASALWAHPDRPDGLLYRTRNAPDRRAIALFDRAAGVLISDCQTNRLADAEILGRLLDHFGCVLVP
jgi:hypothetical protein